MLRSCFALFVGIASPVLGQSGPSFDCGKAESSVEKLVCADTELARLDRQVSERYAATLKVVRGLDTGASEAEHELRGIQRGWIKSRDECWKVDDLNGCVKASYLRRDGDLVSRWILERPVNIAFWACGGNQANEVVTFFFDTDLPSVRFERGDTIDTGSLVPTGSGSKYEGSFGRSIWIKGKEATYREADPDGTTYSCNLIKQE